MQKMVHNIVFFLKKTLSPSTYSAGVVVVNLEVVGLAPGMYLDTVS
jgi:hypothetical protein